MKKKSKNLFIDPKNKEDKQKALDALKDKNFHLDDEDNERVRGGFVERGGGGIKNGKPDQHDDE